MGKMKTFALMAVLVLIFMYVGNLIAGASGARIALIVALAINFFSYFFSDTMVLKHYRATKVNQSKAPELYGIVKRLALKAGLPVPSVYIIPEEIPNAFATGRNPSHAAVAVTKGLLELLNPEEIEGVLAHEMSHIKHYDILIGSIAAVFAGAINILSSMARGRGATRRNNNEGGGLLMIVGVILMPIAASIIQMSVSRTREYAADEGSARLTKHPERLVSALQKLEDYSKKGVVKNSTPQTAHMFIINPFGNFKSNFPSLFSTHPSTANRIARLQKLNREHL